MREGPSAGGGGAAAGAFVKGRGLRRVLWRKRRGWGLWREGQGWRRTSLLGAVLISVSLLSVLIFTEPLFEFLAWTVEVMRILLGWPN